MNILPGVGDGNGGVRLANGVTLATTARANGPVMLGIRPEHLVPDPTGEFAMTVRMSEPLGATTLLHGAIPGLETEFIASLPGVHREADLEGEQRFIVPPSATHVFDASTGKRLA